MADLDPRVLRQFGQRLMALRDSGTMEWNGAPCARISGANNRSLHEKKKIKKNNNNNKIFYRLFQSLSRRSTADKKPEENELWISHSGAVQRDRELWSQPRF